MAFITTDMALVPGLGSPAAVIVLGRRLRAERLAQNLSRTELAARAGISARTLQRIESGSNVGFEAVIALAIALRFESDLRGLFSPRSALPATLDELVQHQRPRQRGGRKKSTR